MRLTLVVTTVIELFICLMALSVSVPLVVGLFTFYHLLRSKHHPADSSNRINHIRLWWFALTREDKFVDQFTWLKSDEWENLKKPDSSIFTE